GCVDGWLTLHSRFGRLPLAEVLEAARSYAADGFPASPTLALSAPGILRLEGADDYRVPDLRPGAMIRRPGLARALAAIAEGGRDAWYGGEFGERLLSLGDGEYTASDLASPLADWVDPLSADAFGKRLWTVPPNSQGYLTLAGAWIADGLDLPSDPCDPLWAHLLIESARQAAFDRLDVLYEGADGSALVDPARLAPRRAALSPSSAASPGGGCAPGRTVYMCPVG